MSETDAAKVIQELRDINACDDMCRGRCEKCPNDVVREAVDFITASLSREAALVMELNKLVIKYADTLNELDKSVLTVRDWHTTAIKMRDMTISGESDGVDDFYFNVVLKLPFYGAQGDPLPSEKRDY